MIGKTSDSAPQVNPQLIAVRRTPTFQGASDTNQCTDRDHKAFSSGTDNPALEPEQTYGVNLDDGLGSDSGTISTSTLNLVDSPTNNLVRQNYLRGVTNDFRRVSSLEGRELPLRGESDPRDPESLTIKTKPFYRRAWVAYLLYVLLLSMLAAAILALAVNRYVIIPNETMRGEQRHVLVPREENASSNVNSKNHDAPDTGATAPIVTRTDNGLPEMTENHPAVTTTKSPAIVLSPEIVSTETVLRENLLFVLSSPGPLQSLNV